MVVFSSVNPVSAVFGFTKRHPIAFAVGSAVAAVTLYVLHHLYSQIGPPQPGSASTGVGKPKPQGSPKSDIETSLYSIATKAYSAVSWIIGDSGTSKKTKDLGKKNITDAAKGAIVGTPAEDIEAESIPLASNEKKLSNSFFIRVLNARKYCINNSVIN